MQVWANLLDNSQLQEEFTVVNLKYMYTLLYYKHNENSTYVYITCSTILYGNINTGKAV
jgi:hypothetical protein